MLKHVKEASSSHALALHGSWHSGILALLKPLNVLFYPLSLLELLLLLFSELGLVRSNLPLAAADAHLALLDLLHLLLVDTLLDELIQLVLGLDHVLRIGWHQALYDQVRLLLVLKG